MRNRKDVKPLKQLSSRGIVGPTMLNESAIQNATKFQGPHFRLSGSTIQEVNNYFLSFSILWKEIPGFKSSLTSINCAVERLGSICFTANLSAQYRTLEVCRRSMMESSISNSRKEGIR
jgi:hypothetical protein